METGFQKLDNIINGLMDEELICIASRPGLGKTTLSIDIVNNVSKQAKNKIVFVSLENSKEQLEKRISSNNVEIMTDRLSIDDIETSCMDLFNIHQQLSLIVIDYLQLIKSNNTFNVNEVVDIVKSLKQLSIRLNVPIIITSQLARYNGEKPTLDDLKVDVSNLFDKVLLLFKENENKLKIDVAKNNNSSLGVIELGFDKEKLSFNK